MKKTFLIISVLVLICVLISCGGDKKPEETVGEVTTVAEAATAVETAAENTEDGETTVGEETLPEEISVKTAVPGRLEDYSADAYVMTEGFYAFPADLDYAFSGNVGHDLKIHTRFVGGEAFVGAEALAKLIGFACVQDKFDVTLTYKNTAMKFKIAEDKALINGTEVDCTTPIHTNGKALLPLSWVCGLLGYCVEVTENAAYIASDAALTSQERKNEAMELAEKYRATVCDLSDVECDKTGVGKYEKTDYSERLVGIAYTTWMRSDFPSWGSGTWDLPLLGNYCSNDRDVIYQHGVWLAEAGVDFVFVDWSNNTDYDPAAMRDSRPDFRMIEEATDLLFEIWSTIPNAPKICIFVGPGHNGIGSVNNGNHQKKVDQVYNDYVNGKYKDMYFCYEGKPLLMCYGATPNQYGTRPKWDDDRFTVRWVTGFIGQQSGLFKAKEMRSTGFWSWEERGTQTFTVVDGKVECVTCTAASRSQGNEGDAGYIPAYGRDNGMTLKRQFQRANDLGSKIVLLVSWNEWTTGEQISQEISKDLEPSVTFGTFYYDLMCQQIKKFKGLN